MKTLLSTLFFLPLSLFFFKAEAEGNTFNTIINIAPLEDAIGHAKISGTVIDSVNAQPIPFATIALTDPKTNKPIDGTICDENGKFALNKVNEGTYTLTISFLGYNTKTFSGIFIDSKNKEIDLDTIKLGPKVQILKEVTIEGQKALIEEKVDRTVYNAENDASNKGGDATDVLRKVPNLSVDLDGNVTIRGSQNIKVLINNRPSTIAANSVADAMKQIPSDMIKSVEVITSPSAKYDAEGSGGIINIITKKNAIDGFNLNINGSAGFRGSNLGLNGSFRKGKMAFSLGGWGRAGYNTYGSFKNSQITYSSTDTLTNLQSADTRNSNMFGRYTLGWDYDINPKNFISTSLQFGLRNFKTFQDGLLTESYNDGTLQQRSLRDVNVSDLSNNWDLNLNYIKNFDKPQKEFSILTQFSRNNRTNNFVNIIMDQNDLDSSRIKNQNQSFNQEITLQADYINPITKTQTLEVGAKQIMRNVSSDYTYYYAGADGVYTPSKNSNLANVFNYDQNITSGYLSYTINFLKNYTAKAGARYEYTTIDAHFQNDENKSVNLKPYGVLVPSANIFRKFDNGNTLKAAYNRRIQRPSLQYLNPNIQASNPLQPTIGNPDLKPEYTNNYELSYSTLIKNTSLTFTGFMRNTTGAIQRLRLEPKGDTITTTFRNIGNEDTYGFSIFANIRLGNKLTLNGGTDVYYMVLKNNVPDPMLRASNEGFVASYRAFGSYNIGKGWALQLFSFYRGRRVQLQGSQGGFGIYSLNIKKDFNNKRGSIGIGAENFLNFNGFKIRNEINSAYISQNSTTVFNNMNFKINLSYRLGKLNANDNISRRRKRSVSNDDLKEGGDNGMQQPSAPGGGEAPAPSNRGQWQGQGKQEKKQENDQWKGKPEGTNQHQDLDSLNKQEMDSINYSRPRNLNEDSTKESINQPNELKKEMEQLKENAPQDSLQKSSNEQVNDIDKNKTQGKKED